MNDPTPYFALSLFLIMCACAVPILAFAGLHTDAQRLGSVGVPAGVLLWVRRDALTQIIENMEQEP